MVIEMRILIADDERYTREGIVSMIDWELYDIDCVMQAKDGEEALEIATWLQPEIILSDIKMPKLNGIEFVEKLNEICKKPRILFMSSYMEIEYLKSAIRLSAIDYIQKPLNMENLKETLLKTVELVKKDLIIDQDRESAKNMHTVMLTYQSIPSSMQVNLKQMLEIPHAVEVYYCFILETDSDIKGNEIGQHLIEHRFFFALGLKKEGTYVLILGKTKNQSISLEKVSQWLIKNEKIIRIAYDSNPAPIELIWMRYQNSEQALSRYFFFPDENCFPVIEENQAVLSIDLDKISEFETLVTNNSPNVLAWIDNFKTEVCENNYLIEQVKSIYFAFINTIIELNPELCHSIYVAHGKPIEPDELWTYVGKAVNINVLHNMLREVIELYQREDSAKTVNRIIRDAIQYIHVHYQDQELNVNNIADVVHLSPTYLNTSFKKETNCTIKRYIIDYRIEKAKKMLKDNQYKIKDISNKCGFADNGYFAKVFRKEEGMTPLEYRDRFFGKGDFD